MNEFKDTLTLYEELVSSGVKEEQAKIQAHQHGAAYGAINGAINNFTAVLNRFEKKLDSIQLELKWIMRIGGFISVTLITIGVQIYLK